MNGYNDPRRASYFTMDEWGTTEKYCGMRRGIIIPNQASIGHQFSGFTLKVSDPVCWMNAAEVAFLEAEAVAVFGYDMGGSAKDFYEKGIALSFEQWGAGSAAQYIADNSSLYLVHTPILQVPTLMLRHFLPSPSLGTKTLQQPRSRSVSLLRNGLPTCCSVTRRGRIGEEPVILHSFLYQTGVTRVTVW